MSAVKPRVPAGLGVEGRRLWASLASRYDFDPGELTTLAAACRQVDDVEALEAELRRTGLMVKGSRGQERLSPVVGEVRLARAAVARLLSALALPDDTGDVSLPSPATLRAQKAARSRWARVAQDRADRRPGGSS